jgi:putative toxin-antitoxin system antitoxin component (TIGR02293 family)
MSDVEKGLPLTALDRIVHAIAPDETGFAYRVVPRFERRARHLPRLTPEESRVARLASVWSFAMDIWKSAKLPVAGVCAAHDAGRPPPDRCYWPASSVALG